MSELNVTEGEWEVDECLSIWSDEGECVANCDRCVGISKINKEANAHLMAASKELYEALVEFHGQYHCVCGHPYCKDCDRTKQAEAALAKARGES